MKIMDQLKGFINNGNYKKIVYNLLAIIVVCIIALLSWDVFFPKTKDVNVKSLVENNSEKGSSTNSDVADSMEVQLKNILSQIKGVGEVEVMITYDSSSEVIPASNTTKSNQTTEEKDAQGGTRTIKHEDLSQNIVTSNANGDRIIVIKEVKPQIRGVVVVAEGAGDMVIKNELIEAVKTIFQIPTNKVIVYEKKEK